MKSNVKTLLPVAVAALAFAAGSSHAVIDITAATTGIADAQVAVLGVLGAFITMAAAVLGVRMVLGFIKRG